MQIINMIQSKFQLGWAAHQQGRLEDAARAYMEILRLYPSHFASLHLLGVIRNDTGQHAEAVELIGKAIRINPNIDAAYINYGNALQELGRLDEALAAFDKAIVMNPGEPEAQFNRGNALRWLRRFDEAVASYDKAIGLKPDHATSWCNRGIALHELGRLEDALTSYGEALRLDPNYMDVRSNRSRTELLLGDFDKGWQSYEYRKKSSQPVGDRGYPRPMAASLADMAGKTVLVHWEQGLGDTLQFCRYLRPLEAAGAKILFAPQPRLMALMQSLEGDITLVDADRPGRPFDLHCPLLSLPLLFGTRLETIPAPGPYLFVPPDRIAQWRARIGGDGMRVGICWEGSRVPGAPDRSFPVAHFDGVSRLAGVRLISLHKGAGEAQLASLPAGMTVETLGEDFDTGPDAFLDTAAVMRTLDLVITSDTSIAHLAGALGVPTFVALDWVPEWRWQLGRSDTPWYPGMRLFRQPQRGDWAGAFAQIEQALRQRLV